MYGLTFEKSLKMFGNTDLADKLEFQEKRIAELTHALNDLYEAINSYTDTYGLMDCEKLEDALEEADELLEGN